MSKKTIGIIVAVVVICAGAFGGWMYHSAKLDKMRNAGAKELAGIVVLDDYREAQQEEVSRILEDSEAKINKAKDKAAVDAVLDEARTSVAAVKTAAQLDAEEGAAALDEITSLDQYRTKQQKKVKKILDEAKAAVAQADSPEAIQEIIKDAKDRIAKIKTDKQLTAEEKAAAEKKAQEEAEAAAAAARQKQQAAQSGSRSNSSGGCVSNDAANYY